MSLALVTGGAGFLGSHLVDFLIDSMHLDVVVLDDLSGGFQENIHPKATFVEGSIVDHESLRKLFIRYPFKYVYHLGAYAAEGLSSFIKRFNHTNNLIGSVNLINESVKHNVKSFLFTSSIAVYGTNQLPMREDMIPIPEDSYGIAKLAVEQELRVSHDFFGLPYVIFRPHNVYGERQNLGDRYRNVVGIFMNQIMQDKPITIFGNGEQRRAFTYVKDIIPTIAESIMCPKAKNEIINLGSEKHYSVNELVTHIFEAFGKTVPIHHVEERKEVKYAYSDHSKMKDIFPNTKETELKKGIAFMADWVKQKGSRKSQSFEGIELFKNLPSVWR